MYTIGAVTDEEVARDGIFFVVSLNSITWE